MKKVLVITYYWPPTGGSGVQRWLKFAKYLPEFQWEPIIYTPENPDMSIQDGELLKDISANLKVLKKPILEPYALGRIWGGKEVQNTGIVSQKKSLKQQFSLWVRGNLFIPDPRVWWVKPSVRYLKKYIVQEEIDLIVTTGPPHSMHLIGLELKKAIKVKWVADFRDPWSKLDFFDEYKMGKRAQRKHLQMEKEVLQNADLCLTVSHYWEQDFKRLGARKTAFVTNGYDEEDFKNTNHNKTNRFVVGHFGLLNAFRSSKALWEALNELCEENESFKKTLLLSFAGVVDQAVIDQIRSYSNLKVCFNYLGYLSHSEVLKAYESSAMHLLLLNDTPIANGHLPGKLFEYLNAKKPILALGLKESDVCRILKETQMGEVCSFDNKEAIKRRINEVFAAWEKGDGLCHGKQIENYTRRALTGTLSALFNQII